MKYYLYMYIAISLILLGIATLKVGFSITLVFLLLFIAVTAMACVDNIKTLNIKKKHYIPIIIFAILYNVYTAFGKLTDMNNILKFSLHISLSFIVPWLIFWIINKILNYNNRTVIFNVHPIIPASFFCIIGFNSALKFICLFALAAFIYVFPYSFYNSYKNDKKKFKNYVWIIIGLILSAIANFVDCKTALYFLIGGLYFCFKGFREITENNDLKNVKIEQLVPIVPIFVCATLLTMLYV